MGYEGPGSMLDQIDSKRASIQQNMATASDIRLAVMLSTAGATVLTTTVLWVKRKVSK